MVAGLFNLASLLIRIMIKHRLFNLAAELTQKFRLLQINVLLMHLIAKILLCGFIQLSLSSIVHAQALPEYQVKAAFLYNFANYTQWPVNIGSSFNICIYGDHPFGDELNQLQDKKINQLDISISYINQIESLSNCQMVFISHSAAFAIKAIHNHLKDKPVLKITDNLNSLHDGITINIVVVDGKIKFDVNLLAARNSGLNLSSQLLRFAREVYK
jgi:YfiR/HmsC-like